MELTAENVNAIFLDCLFKEGENTENHTVGIGLKNTVGFHPQRLESHKENIAKMCECLPKEFQEKEGGGMSFLNMCYDRSGSQWASLHQTMDELVILGHATGKIEYLMPREKWRNLPSGMPYLMVKESETIDNPTATMNPVLEASKETGEWMPIDGAKLPERGDKVLVFFGPLKNTLIGKRMNDADGNDVWVVYFSDGEKPILGPYAEEITHWMALPDMPKET